MILTSIIFSMSLIYMKSSGIKLLSWRRCDEINCSGHLRAEEAECRKDGLDSACWSLSLGTGLGAVLRFVKGPEQGVAGG